MQRAVDRPGAQGDAGYSLMPSKPPEILPDDTPAPECWIVFRCPVCSQRGTRNAFLGVPRCTCRRPWPPMEALRLLRDGKAG